MTRGLTTFEGTTSAPALRPAIIPACYAHRGARGHAPENTLLSFDLAFDLGADGIECDAQLSSDGQVVIIHDSTVNRTTNGRGPVGAQSFEALRTLDAGWPARAPQRIPSLQETLSLVWRRGGLLNLELKADSDGEAVALAERVAPILDALPVDDPVRSGLLLSSFNFAALTRAQELMPWARFGALFGGRTWTRASMIEAARRLRAHAIHPHPRILSEDAIKAAHDAGLQVNVWTANRISTIRQLISWEVDAIFSDYPERVVIARRLAATGVVAE
ncbi:MAG TPA: glycerophosphodiester phosphodiesterase family protein [Ktedonobacterales bacterium]